MWVPKYLAGLTRSVLWKQRVLARSGIHFRYLGMCNRIAVLRGITTGVDGRVL